MEVFIAYYEGKKIAKSKTLEQLMNMRAVRSLLGKKELIIRHITSGGAKVVYRGDVDKGAQND
jgi:hypothetical protein